MTVFGLREVKRKKGDEQLLCSGKPVGASILEFWQWNASNLLSNTLRGHFAEFLVATALKAKADTRIEWDTADVITPDAKRIEVKSAAYVQAWEKIGRPSPIRFGIAKKMSFDWTTHSYGPIGRHSDCHVFCLLGKADDKKVAPTDLDQWNFYVISTHRINERFSDQKSVSLATIIDLGCEPVTYDNLAAAVGKELSRVASVG